MPLQLELETPKQKLSKALKLFSISEKSDRSGEYLSKKMSIVIPHSNLTELVFLHYLDVSDNIVSFLHENLRISYKYEARYRLHYPDYDVSLKDGRRVIWELKGSKMNNETKAKKLAGEKFAKDNGYDEYRIILQNEVFNMINTLAI